MSEWLYLPPEMRAHIMSFLDPVSVHLLACTTPHEDVTQSRRNPLLHAGLLPSLLDVTIHGDSELALQNPYLDSLWIILWAETLDALLQCVGRAHRRFVRPWVRHVQRLIPVANAGYWPARVLYHFAASGMPWSSSATFPRGTSVSTAWQACAMPIVEAAT